MTALRAVSFLFTLGLLLAAPGLSRADCKQDGDSCPFSGDNGEEPGRCHTKFCTTGTIMYECMICIADPDGGDDAGCDCRIGPHGKDGSVAALMLALGFSALAWSRRSRR